MDQGSGVQGVQSANSFEEFPTAFPTREQKPSYTRHTIVSLRFVSAPAVRVRFFAGLPICRS